MKYNYPILLMRNQIYREIMYQFFKCPQQQKKMLPDLQKGSRPFKCFNEVATFLNVLLEKFVLLQSLKNYVPQWQTEQRSP